MRPNRLHDLVSLNTPALNAWLSCNSTYIAEVLGHCGFDSVTVDLQHGQLGMDAVSSLLQAISATDAIPLVRCSENNFGEINKLLDSGAYGIICPMIETRQDAERFVRACRYPPLGARSFGPARGLLYGGSDYFNAANNTLLTLAMIETAQGVQNIDNILDVAGLDGIYIGPNDLAISMGIAPGGNWEDAALGVTIRHIIERCQSKRKYVGIFCNDMAMAYAMKEMGLNMLTPGNDIHLLRSAATARLAQLRESS